MDFISESRLVYVVSASCVALTQTYFLSKHQSANKVYLVRRPVARRHAYERRTIGIYSNESELEETLVKNESKLPNLDSLLKLVYGLSVVLNICLMLKYFLICLLDAKAMRDYRYLDCLLIGRVSMNGRTTVLAKYIGLCLPIFQLGWRFTMLYMRPNFNFTHMEFLMQNPNELIVCEAETEQRLVSNQLTAARGAAKASLPQQQATSTADSDVELEHRHSTLMNYRNPFVSEGPLGGANENFSRLRPNRTFRAWARLSQWLLLYLLLTFGSALIGLVPALRMSLPLLLTRPGFRLNYFNCVDWISRQANGSDYAFIDTLTTQDETKASLARASAFMPFADYIQLNLYHSVRLCADVCENLFIFVECFISFVIYTALCITCALDIYSYTEDINRRAKCMIRTLAASQRLGGQPANKSQRNNKNLPTLPCLADAGGKMSAGLVNNSSENSYELDLDNDHRAQMLDLQAMIVDMFALIDTHNSYASFFTLYTIAIWIVYSAVCSVPWLFVPLMAETSKLEWYLFEALSTLFFFIIIGSLNSVRRSTLRLYQSLSTLSALDYTKDTARNDRWLGLLRHFSPSPLYCFTAFRTSEISWLLGLKMFAWLASALFVSSSFLVRAVYRAE